MVFEGEAETGAPDGETEGDEKDSGAIATGANVSSFKGAPDGAPDSLAGA